MRSVGVTCLGCLVFLTACLTKDERVDGVREMRAQVTMARFVGCGDGFDQDGDGIVTADDNCPVVANGGQADGDGNGIGDACEGDDVDGDGIVDADDNCPERPNRDQADRNGNEYGDVCDPAIDRDGDELADSVDVCPEVWNPGQSGGGVALQFDYSYVLGIIDDDGVGPLMWNYKLVDSDTNIYLDHTGVMREAEDTTLPEVYVQGDRVCPGARCAPETLAIEAGRLDQTRTYVLWITVYYSSQGQSASALAAEPTDAGVDAEQPADVAAEPAPSQPRMAGEIMVETLVPVVFGSDYLDSEPLEDIPVFSQR